MVLMTEAERAFELAMAIKSSVDIAGGSMECTVKFTGLKPADAERLAHLASVAANGPVTRVVTGTGQYLQAGGIEFHTSDEEAGEGHA